MKYLFICYIVTTPEERTALLESLKSRYNANEFDKIPQIVEERPPEDAEGNFITDRIKEGQEIWKR